MFLFWVSWKTGSFLPAEVEHSSSCNEWSLYFKFSLSNNASFVFSAALSSLPFTWRFLPFEFVMLRGFPLESVLKNKIIKYHLKINKFMRGRDLNLQCSSIPNRRFGVPRQVGTFIKNRTTQISKTNGTFSIQDEMVQQKTQKKS